MAKNEQNPNQNPPQSNAQNAAQPQVAPQSQLQSASGEPEQKAKTPESKRNSGEVGGDGTDIQFFDTTIAKIDKDGNEVMSDHLAPGEKRRSDVDDTYFYRAAPGAEDTEK